MKVLAIVLIAFVVFSNTEYILFGQNAVNAIFKEKRDSLILFTNPADEETSNLFKAAAENNVDVVFTTVDKEENKDHFDRFAEYLGLKVEPTPTLILFLDAKKKYVGDVSDLSAESIAAFIAKAKSGEISPFRKSAPVPVDEKRAVRTIVGSTFKTQVLGSDKEYLLKIYAPWCGHCKKIAPEYEAAAELIAHNPNVVIADFDGTLNEAEGIEISGYPTIYWYGKDKTVTPITFNGQRDKDGILTWIKDHTEYEWVEPVEPPKTEEQL